MVVSLDVAIRKLQLTGDLALVHSFSAGYPKYVQRLIFV
jgi:hypothetical protein